MIKLVVLEVALLCNDLTFKDFPKNIYEQAYYRATRILAKKYETFSKVESFIWGDRVEDINTDCVLDLTDFLHEVQVTVNGNRLNSVNNEIEVTGQYYIKRIEEDLLFNYAVLPKALTDEIVIIYNVIPDKLTYSDGEYFLPHIYEEELISETLSYICKLGISKFDNEKSRKYEKLFMLNKSENRDTIKPDIIEQRDWATVKTWKVY